MLSLPELYHLAARGLIMPFVFSLLAPELAGSAACAGSSARSPSAHGATRRFAGPHELKMALRWGLAHVVRMYGGQGVPGLLDHELYAQWRGRQSRRRSAH